MFSYPKEFSIHSSDTTPMHNSLQWSNLSTSQFSPHPSSTVLFAQSHNSAPSTPKLPRNFSLKNALINAPNLRSLAIDVHHNPNISRLSGTRTDRLQLPLLSSDKLLPLEALHIHATPYALDEPHCTRLLHSMNWRLLKRLSLFTANPVPFFQAFTSALPLPFSLELALHFSHRDIWPTPESHFTGFSSALAFLAFPPLSAPSPSAPTPSYPQRPNSTAPSPTFPQPQHPSGPPPTQLTAQPSPTSPSNRASPPSPRPSTNQALPAP
jgi:hypothetical protein